MIRNLLRVSLCLLLLTGCTNPHLEIFPPLSDETLVSRQLTVEQMHADIDAFYAGMLMRHPDLANYADEASLQAAVESLKNQIDKPMIRTAFYRVVGQLSHQFNDGHSFLIWPYQEYELLKAKDSKPFPFVVEVNQQALYVKHDYQSGEQSVSAGSQLVAINGRKVEDILDIAQQYVGGETRHLREQIVGRRFGPMLWSVFGDIDDFTVELIEGGVERQLSIDAGQDWQSDDVVADTREFYFEERSPGIGYLYLGHFDIDPDWFETFIDESFASAKALGVHSLIIDIRDNTGGNTDTVSYLASYLAKAPFRMVSEVREKLNNENRGFFNYKGEVGEMLTEEWDDFISPQDSDVVYTGDVYLLVSPISYSAAIVFATTLKDYNMATLVGQATGGFANQTAQGNLFNLPHSELRAYVPTRLLLRPSGDRTVSGVIPHVPTTPNQQDLIDKKDTEIGAVLDLIESKGLASTQTPALK